MPTEIEEINLTLLQLVESTVDTMRDCAGQAIIPQHNFTRLAELCSGDDDVKLSIEELEELFYNQALRFTACGGNNVRKYGVLRKNPKGGWQYLINLITAK